MLGLLLIYFIGKAFYDLAELHNKRKWLFAILGVISYYFGSFLAGIAVAIYYELNGKNIEELSDFALSAIGLPLGLLFCWGFYVFLKHQWKKVDRVTNDSEILDEEFF